MNISNDIDPIKIAIAILAFIEAVVIACLLFLF